VAWLAAGLARRGEHALAPDLIGFGRSDKLKKEAQHQPHWHGQVLHELLQRLLAVQPGPSRQVLLVLPADALALAGGVYTAEVTVSKAPAALHIQAAVLACPPTLPLPWAQAPFPDAGHRAGPRAWQRWNIPAVPWPAWHWTPVPRPACRWRRPWNTLLEPDGWCASPFIVLRIFEKARCRVFFLRPSFP